MTAGASEQGASVRTWLTRRLSGVRGKYEACFLFLLLMIIEWIIPGPASLAQIAPHPFWIPVVLLSVQYGSGTGLVVAALAAGLSWAAGWPPQTSQEDFYTYSLRVWREPVLWILCAIVIGGLRNRQIRERLALEERLRITEEQRDTIAGFCNELQEHAAVHERRAATARSGSLEAGLASLQQLREAAEPELTQALHAAVQAWLGQARWSYFPLEEGELRHAHSERARLDACFPVRTALVYAVACHRPRVLSVFDESEASLLDGVGVFAASVRAGENGACLGLFVLETIPADRLDPASAVAVAAIAGALGEAVDRMRPSGAEPASRRPAETGFPVEAACLPHLVAGLAIEPGEVPCSL
ncbi:hypothetical protein [Methylobacterium durans]|uniref:GAF domain-containing protein n=1 Tax=Methylobacterium durans TaxID=2202825 RepID=A0A2U8W3I7_9HYPH|nr:hypothetical protein [Methylobacterium durans]AWN39932.1 hypothetical protein DK389_04475 [Methylobacterium durans]